MPGSTEYRKAYPRGGQVALLCEGDLIGYEASLLRRWADDRLGTNPLVDIWPCGTGEAIFGMTDAIGRACPVLVIEDRDFRTHDEAAADCEKSRKDRERREVRMVGWRAWRRNEIENYLLESDVLTPVMVDAFGCSAQNVQDGLAEILPSLVLYQVTQYCRYRARLDWEGWDPSHILLSNLASRPTWDDATNKPVAPKSDDVRARLQENIAKWQAILPPRDFGNNPPYGFDLLAEFDAKSREWQGSVDDPMWRIDWAGKETLQWLRMWLSSHFGLFDPNSRTRVKLKWGEMRSKERGARDRAIESALRPLLVGQFVTHLSQVNAGELSDEWRGIEQLLRDGQSNVSATGPASV